MLARRVGLERDQVATAAERLELDPFDLTGGDPEWLVLKSFAGQRPYVARIADVLPLEL